MYLNIRSADGADIIDAKNIAIEIYSYGNESYKKVLTPKYSKRKEYFTIQHKFQKELDDFGMFVLDFTYKGDDGQRHFFQKDFNESDFVDGSFKNIRNRGFEDDNFDFFDPSQKDYPYHFIAKLKKSEISIKGVIKDRKKNKKLKIDNNTKIKWSRSTKDQINFIKTSKFDTKSMLNELSEYEFKFQSGFDGTLNSEPYILIIKAGYRIKFHKLNKYDQFEGKTQNQIIKLDKINSNTKIEKECPQAQKYSKDCGKCICKDDNEIYYPIHDICGPDCAEDEIAVYKDSKYTCKKRMVRKVDGKELKVTKIDTFTISDFIKNKDWFPEEEDPPCLKKIKTTLKSIKKCDMQDIEETIYNTFFCDEDCSQFIENSSQRISLLQIANTYSLEIKGQYNQKRFKKELQDRRDRHIADIEHYKKSNLTDIERVLFLYSFIDHSTDFSRLDDNNREIVLDYYKNRALFYEWYIHSFFFLKLSYPNEKWFIHYPDWEGISFHNELKYTVCDEDMENRLYNDELGSISKDISPVSNEFYKIIINDSMKCWEEYQRYSEMLKDFGIVDKFIDIKDKKQFLKELKKEVL